MKKRYSMRTWNCVHSSSEQQQQQKIKFAQEMRFIQFRDLISV